MSSTMARSTLSKPRSETPPQTKTRNCLMCNDVFLSTWPGERICKRCKSTVVWREG